jgi:hypothetical protein
MLFKEAVSKLEESKEFKDWKKECDDSYLAHGFISFGDNSHWQIGYYNKKTDKITSFIMGPEIVVNAEENIFKEGHDEVKALELDKIKINIDQALKAAEELQQKEYTNDSVMKKIMIIQNIEQGQVWNVTFVTSTFKTLNIRVNAETGKIVEHKSNSIMDFKK